MTYVKGPLNSLNWNPIGSNGNCMFRAMTDNTRKRSREDDSCEFMPLSKRINNLHINNNLGSTSTQIQQESNQVNGIHVDPGMGSSNSSSDSEQRPNYDPGVTSSQSSYYFDNKLLFELHLERIQRTGQQFPF